MYTNFLLFVNSDQEIGWWETLITTRELFWWTTVSKNTTRYTNDGMTWKNDRHHGRKLQLQCCLSFYREHFYMITLKQYAIFSKTMYFHLKLDEKYLIREKFLFLWIFCYFSSVKTGNLVGFEIFSQSRPLKGNWPSSNIFRCCFSRFFPEISLIFNNPSLIKRFFTVLKALALGKRMSFVTICLFEPMSCALTIMSVYDCTCLSIVRAVC